MPAPWAQRSIPMSTELPAHLFKSFQHALLRAHRAHCGRHQPWAKGIRRALLSTRLPQPTSYRGFPSSCCCSWAPLMLPAGADSACCAAWGPKLEGQSTASLSLQLLLPLHDLPAQDGSMETVKQLFRTHGACLTRGPMRPCTPCQTPFLLPAGPARPGLCRAGPCKRVRTPLTCAAGASSGPSPPGGRPCWRACHRPMRTPMGPGPGSPGEAMR